jgi:DNA polymerase-3 subunit epsilon
VNLLFFDTDTTGLPDWRSPSDASHQPHVIQAAAILTDELGNELHEWQTIIQPGPGAVMAPEALAAHGISLDRAMDEGVPLADAWRDFCDLIAQANGIVGHNISFDIRIMRIAGARANGLKWECPLPHRCTMKMATPIVNIPPTEKMLAAGFSKPKSANLAECVRFFFDEDHGGAHDALADVKASKRVYFAIKERLAA